MLAQRFFLPVRVMVFFFGFLCVCPAFSIETDATGAITNVTTIDAINGVRENQTVFFKQDSITKIQNSTAPIGNTHAIDGKGKYLIPGLWDFHVHLTYEDSLSKEMPKLLLSYGITSVRDTGGLLEKVLPIVKEMRAHNAIAPRVFYAGPLLDGKDVVYDGESRPHIGVQNINAQSSRERIKFLKDNGASFIKIYEMVSPKVFSVMIDTARELNLPVDSHVPLSMRARIAGAEVDSIEHLRNIELDCAKDNQALHEERLAILQNEDRLPGFVLRSSLHKLQRIPAIRNYSRTECLATLNALSNTLQVPTLRLNSISLNLPFERGDWAQAFSTLPIKTQNDWAKQIQAQREQSELAQPSTEFADWSLFLVGLMKEQGVPIGAGTDTPIGLAIPGYSLHAELEMLVRAGLTPMEALNSATVEPAKYFSLEDQMGSIDVGKKADMVLLEKNPLNDIANTKSITHVISHGRIFSAQDFHPNTTH